MPYRDVFKRFDRDHTFFYCDPPYYGCENYYGKGIFKREDFITIRDILKGLKGKFILSLNDTKATRELFGGFYFEKVETTYQISVATGKKRVTELLIMNFKPKAKA